MSFNNLQKYFTGLNATINLIESGKLSGSFNKDSDLYKVVSQCLQWRKLYGNAYKSYKKLQDKQKEGPIILEKRPASRPILPAIKDAGRGCVCSCAGCDDQGHHCHKKDKDCYWY